MSFSANFQHMLPCDSELAFFSDIEVPVDTPVLLVDGSLVVVSCKVFAVCVTCVFFF